ncbi:MAG: 30S ribosomal protein S17 [Erysipelotrichia bacterium]|nr:30S ribosomal protein S17 [Erysipelotrichia bacterium]
MEVRTTKARRAVQGVVVSDKNAKTIVVLVETHRKHPKYGKRVKYGKKYYAHDEENSAKVGDVVTIMETRKLSAIKRWRLVSIDRKENSIVIQTEAEPNQEEIVEVEAAVEAPAENKEDE